MNRSPLLTVLAILSLALWTLAQGAANRAFAHDPPQSTPETAVPRFKIPLTDAEKAFLNAHPVIRFGTDDTWHPYVVKEQDGHLSGFDPDIIALINGASGANIQIVTGQWKTIVKKAEGREIDGLATSAPIQSRKAHFLFSRKYVSDFPIIVLPWESELRLTGLDDLAGKKVAVQIENLFHQSLIQSGQNISIVNVHSEIEAVKAMFEGRADACVASASTYASIQQVFMRTIKIGYVGTEHPLNIVYSVRKDWPELVSILDKAIAAIPAKTYDQLFFKWFSIEPFRPAQKPGAIRIAILDNYAPYTFVNAKGEPDGYGVELIKAVARELGLEIVIWVEVWESALTKLSNGQIDMIPMMPYSEGQDPGHDFSQVHTIAYDAFFTRKESPGILRPEDLKDKRILLMKNDRAHEYVQTLPFIDPSQLTFENNMVEALRKLHAGKADVAVMPKLTGLQLIKKHGIPDIDTHAKVIQDYSRLFTIAVREGNIELLEKLENGLQLIKENGEYRKIHEKWFGMYEPFGRALKFFVWVVLLLALTLAGLFLWTFTLKRQVAQRTQSLKTEIDTRKQTEKALSLERDHLQQALNEIKTLKGLLPVCAHCKKIRDDKGYWNQMEEYITTHSEAEFSHGICPECSDKLYGDQDWYMEMKKKRPR